MADGIEAIKQPTVASARPLWAGAPWAASTVRLTGVPGQVQVGSRPLDACADPALLDTLLSADENVAWLSDSQTGCRIPGGSPPRTSWLASAPDGYRRPFAAGGVDREHAATADSVSR
jgi:hypothetical protein